MSIGELERTAPKATVSLVKVDNYVKLLLLVHITGPIHSKGIVLFGHAVHPSGE